MDAITDASNSFSFVLSFDFSCAAWKSGNTKISKYLTFYGLLVELASTQRKFITNFYYNNCFILGKFLETAGYIKLYLFGDYQTWNL